MASTSSSKKTGPVTPSLPDPVIKNQPQYLAAGYHTICVAPGGLRHTIFDRGEVIPTDLLVGGELERLTALGAIEVIETE